MTTAADITAASTAAAAVTSFPLAITALNAIIVVLNDLAAAVATLTTNEANDAANIATLTSGLAAVVATEGTVAAEIASGTVRTDFATHLQPQIDPASQITTDTVEFSPDQISLPAPTVGRFFSDIVFTSAALVTVTHAVAMTAFDFVVTGGVNWSNTAQAPTFSLSPYTALPAGLSLSSSGVLSGTPTVEGVYLIIVTATDLVGNSTSAWFTITVA